MDQKAAVEKLAALARQCPVVETPADKAMLPIHFACIGKGERIIFVHGGVQGAIGGGPATYGRQHVLAEIGYRLEIAYRPGFGPSPSRGVDDMDDSAQWIADALGDGAHLVGHSWGGAAVLVAAARRPEAVRSLILVEPALQTLALTDPVAQADAGVMAKVFAMVERWATADTPADYARVALESVGRSAGDMGRTEMDEETLVRFGCAALQAKMTPPPALRAAAEKVRQAQIPVLIVSGTWSDTIQAVGTITARATAGKHVIIDSPNHFPQYENAREFNQIIDGFITSVT